MENFIFSLFFPYLTNWGVKFCLREGDCVLGGQPMGIPTPYPSPCPCVTHWHFFTLSEVGTEEW